MLVLTRTSATSSQVTGSSHWIKSLDQVTRCRQSGLTLLRCYLGGWWRPLACHGNFFPDRIQSGELERRFVARTRPIEHADLQSSAFRQRLQKPGCIVFVTCGLSIRGRSPGEPDGGLVVDLIVDLDFAGTRRPPCSLGANQEVGASSATSHSESVRRIFHAEWQADRRCGQRGVIHR
jgi:hypothetical protein